MRFLRSVYPRKGSRLPIPCPDALDPGATRPRPKLTPTERVGYLYEEGRNRDAGWRV
jgi:hypothetical protein